MCDVARMPSGPRTRLTNFFFVFALFRLVMCDMVRCECVMFDVVRCEGCLLW